MTWREGEREKRERSKEKDRQIGWDSEAHVSDLKGGLVVC